MGSIVGHTCSAPSAVRVILTENKYTIELASSPLRPQPAIIDLAQFFLASSNNKLPSPSATQFMVECLSESFKID